MEATRAEVARATTRSALTAAYQRLAGAAAQVLSAAAGPADRTAGDDEPGARQEPVTVTSRRRSAPAAEEETNHATTITLKSLSGSQVAAAAQVGATTTKTTATFVGHPAIILDRIRWAGAAEKARRGGKQGLTASLERLAGSYEAAAHAATPAGPADTKSKCPTRSTISPGRSLIRKRARGARRTWAR